MRRSQPTVLLLRCGVALTAASLAACGGVVETASSGATAGADAAVDQSASGGTGGAGGGEAGADASSGGADVGGTGGMVSEAAVETGADAAADAADDAGCQPAMKVCAGACVSLDDPAYGCGAADCAPCTLAHATAACASGQCAIGSCDSGWGDCDANASNGCEHDVSADIDNCGQCGNACQPTMLPWGARCCTKGGCYLPENPNGSLDCDCNPANGSEVAGFLDPNNCGQCGQACALPHAVSACSGGVCQLASCNSGWGDCDGISSTGCEADLSTDTTHCGSCAIACALPHATAACASGQCAVGSCESGWSDCDGDASNGCETSLATDVQNCGACGKVCQAAGSCVWCMFGVCSLATCGPPMAECDCNPANGCETNLSFDVANCGTCGHVCNVPHAVPACSSGMCQVASCNSGWGNCDGLGSTGCETDLSTDPGHCGSCATACTPGQICANGACK